MTVIRLEITGRVQGVGFRWFVRQRARALELSGWVRNLESGSVEVVAQGPEESLRVLRIAVAQGPPGAVVREVVPRDPAGIAEYPMPFTVLR